MRKTLKESNNKSRMICKCSKQTEHKLEFFKQKNFDNKNKWYLHKLQSILKNETDKTPCDFEIKAGFTQSQPDDLVIVCKKKRTSQPLDSSSLPQREIKRE